MRQPTPTTTIQQESRPQRYFRNVESSFKSANGSKRYKNWNIDNVDAQQPSRAEPIICHINSRRPMNRLPYKTHYLLLYSFILINPYKHVYPLAVHNSSKLACLFRSSRLIFFTRELFSINSSIFHIFPKALHYF